MAIVGSNRIVLNGATMNKAVEHWLNNELLQDNVKVVSITQNTTSGTFDVGISEPVKEVTKK